jgi:hypothetical protein
MIIATSTNSWVRNLNEFGITEKSLYNMNQQDTLFIIYFNNKPARNILKFIIEINE